MTLPNAAPRLRCLLCGIVAALLAAASSPASAEYVAGLDPYGDNFLSLRSGPGGNYPEITRMGENTVLEVLGAAGPWLKVRLRDGTIGWAHSRWIRSGYPH